MTRGYAPAIPDGVPDLAGRGVSCLILAGPGNGEGDQQAPLWHAQKMIEAAGSARKELKIFTRAEGGYHHCQVDNVSIGTAYMWDWVAEVLQAHG